MNVVNIRNAHKYYNKGKGNELHVMDDVNLELPSAGMIAIFGKSGCGKTTLLNAIGGLDRIQSGTIELFGQNIREDTDTLRNRHIGYIFQNYNLSVTDTVYENVAAALRLCGLTDEVDISERVMAALGNVGMDKYRDRTPDTLSGGQQQRVAIARALVKCPAIILADEPTGNLDEANTVLVMDILKEISKSQLVLLVTHEAELVDFYCDRVIEIVDGRIVEDRVNREARGYVRRDKNDIYLGELSVQETEAPGVKVAYYGEPVGELTLRVVSVGGKLYLKAEGADVKLLDEGSEIRLLEGVFEEAPTEEAAKKTLGGRTWDVSRLTPVTGKHYGRMYHMKNALASAWRENFSKKHKRGKALLRVCLLMLAVVMVFSTATQSAGIRSYDELMDVHNESLFYVPVVPGRDYSALNSGLGENGIEYSRLIGYSPIYDYDYLSFNSSVFMTGRNTRLETEARAQDIAHAAGLTVVAGASTLNGTTEMIITTAVADRLLETSTVNYLNEYRDLIGLVTDGFYPSVGGRLCIAGVVESDEVVFYMDSLALVKWVLEDAFSLPVAAAGQVGMEGRVKLGEFVYIDNGTMLGEPVVGQSYRFLGNDLTLTEVITSRVSLEDYAAYVEKSYGQTLRPILTGGEPDLGAIMEDWLPHLDEYVGQCIELRSLYQEVTFEEWVLATHGHIAGAGALLSVDPLLLASAQLYKDEYGDYPATVEEAEAYAYGEEVLPRVQEMLNVDRLWSEYEQFIYERKENSYYQNTEPCYILHDEDYRRLITHIGTTSEELGMYTYDHDYAFGDYYSHHLQIKSSDPVLTEAFLREVVGEGNYLTPVQVLEAQMNDIRAEVILCAISVLVILVLMCLCVYFIMRSSFMSRVREVGTLRAIGVTRRNLMFRFAVETALLILLTLVVGYLLSAYFIVSMSGAVMFSEMFYFPLWMGGGLLIIICSVSLFFGILPAMLLLRRTPSEILAKFDI